MIVVTMERQVYTWGEGSRGQLGHGNEESRHKPQLVDTLKGKSICRYVKWLLSQLHLYLYNHVPGVLKRRKQKKKNPKNMNSTGCDLKS